ncbi:GTPase ObgE [Candidatus Parcubacteria bacterium]|nr:GTPase ObgE [Candidatus Parcubacteria bacterium]
MAFIDEITLQLSAGRGGDGVVRFKHMKGKDKAGPSGGDGGRGGNVYVVGSRSHHSLSHYKHVKVLAAEKGGNGMRDSLHGKNGEDLVLSFPVGAIVRNLSTGEELSIDTEGEPMLLLKGGYGGYGNEHFKSSVNRTPRESTPGKQAEEGKFFIELRLFADLGLIGLPNAGKTSFLNALTKAKGAVADYPFTTLEPNLGAFHGFIVADIPGLIEGASEGKGLGHKFLRHIRRTRLLVHLISLEHDDAVAAYKTVRKELGRYDKTLLEKEEVVVLTKSDMVDGKKLDKEVKKMKKLASEVFALSLYDDKSAKAVGDALSKLLAK